MKHRLKKRTAISALTLAMAVSVSIWSEKPSEGASIPKLDTIRVALYIDSAKYHYNTAAATFTAAGGLKIGIRTPAAVEQWFNAGTNAVRIAVDDYKAKMIETTDFSAALTMQKRLQALGGSAVVTSQSKSGKLVYIVSEGSYSTASIAKAAMDKWSKDANVASLLGSAKPGVSGPLRLEGGSYASEDAARNAAKTFGAAGLDAYPAVRSAAGNRTYSVMVGSAADATALNNVKSLAAKVSGAPALREADAATPYLLLRDDHTVTATAQSKQVSYSFPAGSTKLWLSTDAAQGIKLSERSSRTYRGAFEASVYNGKLAIVNELPFEQYLYSVVPSEMPSSWPAEALKSQAVAARTYALYQGLAFGIAHVNDTELSQMYTGIAGEKASTTSAVNDTAGVIALYNGKPIETLFSSNAGGQTADATEIWGNAVPYLKSVPSPDQSAAKGLKNWYRVVLPTGESGFVREDLLSDTGKVNPVGARIFATSAEGVNVRQTPIVNEALASVGKLPKGTNVVVIDSVVESNNMNWVAGPFTPEALQKSTGNASPVKTLDAEYGESGRVIQMSVNGKPLSVKTPISYRTLMGGLLSTRFTIDETARTTMLGADEAKAERPGSSGTLYVRGADGASKPASANYYIMNGSGEVRAATRDPQFRFYGYGNGHGVGLSQYGALGLAQLGYDYAYILQYYYKDITIEGK
ncbi:SpoIID/LytB domain protein [Paenibacillus curdlanolyticus YK9]|uniref:SpoIID/LytB domain protein n=1 Tax=Paenibacillus curdlanolyticus YK9 TaxID=717606 RepID=E0IDX3_9BACL|nr:SpoIID/LytB domain-containing protein [Paenibacillus curdlanolyticus]EFM09327.1 SpoIID/LytB domain protein [Paenibacillus curdlanolyticus YK9]